MRSEPLIETTLGAICEQQGGAIQTGPFGRQLHASDYTEAGTPVVMPADIVGGRISTASIARVGPEHVERLLHHQLQIKDIVFSRRGDVTRFARVTAREVGWLCGTGCLKVRVGNGNLALPEWISLALASPDVKEWLVRHAVGATMPNLNTSILGALPLKVPPIEQQRDAVEVCFALDDRIDLLRQTNTTLESIAQALFKSWFIDFDPVRAKQAGRELEGMDAATAALFPAGFEESALGLIPKGWHCGCLGDILIQRVSRTKPSEVTANLAYVPIECITAKSVFLQDSLPGAQAQSSLTLFKEGDILFGAMRPYFHKVCIAPFDGVTRTTAFVLQPKAEHRAFALFAAFDDSTIEFATTHSEGSTIPYAKWSGSLERKPLVLPPSELAAAFETVVAPLLSSGIHATRWAQTLTDAREELLPRLISGKLRLPEAREQLEDALA